MILDCIWTLTRLDVIVKSIPQRDRKFVCVTSRSCENISLHFKVSSKESRSDRENPSAQAVLSPNLLGHRQGLCFVRCETKCCCGSVDSFDARSVTNLKLVPFSFHRSSLSRDVSASLQGEQLDRLIDQ